MKECISSWIYAPYILISNKLSIDIAFILNNNLAVINTVDEKLIIAFILELETNMLSTEQGISKKTHPNEANLILKTISLGCGFKKIFTPSLSRSSTI